MTKRKICVLNLFSNLYNKVSCFQGLNIIEFIIDIYWTTHALLLHKYIDHYIKYLGVMLYNHFKWVNHVTYLCTTTRYLIHKFYLLREFMNQKLLTNIFKTLSKQLFNYGLLLWGGLYKNAIKLLKNVENSILRVIYRKPRQFSTKELYLENVCSTRTLFILSVCHFVYKNTDIKKIILIICKKTRLNNQCLLKF